VLQPVRELSRQEEAEFDEPPGRDADGAIADCRRKAASSRPSGAKPFDRRVRRAEDERGLRPPAIGTADS